MVFITCELRVNWWRK